MQPGKLNNWSKERYDPGDTDESSYIGMRCNGFVAQSEEQRYVTIQCQTTQMEYKRFDEKGFATRIR